MTAPTSSSGSAARAGSDDTTRTARSIPSRRTTGRASFRRSRISATGTTVRRATTTRTTTPSDSSEPNSRIIGTADRWRAREPATAAIMATAKGPIRPMVTPAASSGEWPSPRSSAYRFWNWMAKSTPRPSRMGSAEMVTSVSEIPTSPAAPNAPTRPTRTTITGSRGQRTLNTRISSSTMTPSAMAPRVAMPPWR